MKQSILLILALLTTCGILQAQPYGFRNPTFAPLYYNPGFAGSMGQPRVTLSSLLGSLYPLQSNLFYASYDRVSQRLKGAIGVEAFHSQTKIYLGGSKFSQNQVSGVYAPKFSLGSNWSLSPALKLGYHIQTADVSIADTSGVVSFYNNAMQNHGMNVSPGILINSPAFYFGVASDFLATVKLAEKTIPGRDPTLEVVRNWKLQSGYQFQPKNKADWSLSATGVLIMSKNPEQAMIQLLFQRKWLMLGLGGEKIFMDQPAHSSFLSITSGFRHSRFRFQLNGSLSLEPKYVIPLGLLFTTGTDPIRAGYSVKFSHISCSLVFYLPNKSTLQGPAAPEF